MGSPWSLTVPTTSAAPPSNRHHHLTLAHPFSLRSLPGCLTGLILEPLPVGAWAVCCLDAVQLSCANPFTTAIKTLFSRTPSPCLPCLAASQA